jgi:hypothetical protein
MPLVPVSDLERNMARLDRDELMAILIGLIVFVYRDDGSDFGIGFDANTTLNTEATFPSGSDVCDAISRVVHGDGLLDTPRELQTYTVAAVYADNSQPFVDYFAAVSPAAAVEMAHAAVEPGCELIIAGVFLGGVSLIWDKK